MWLLFTQTLVSTWKATLKSRWSGVITTFKIILMRVLKQYFLEVMTSLFELIPLPLVTLCFSFAWLPPLVRWHTFWMVPEILVRSNRISNPHPPRSRLFSVNKSNMSDNSATIYEIDIKGNAKCNRYIKIDLFMDFTRRIEKPFLDAPWDLQPTIYYKDNYVVYFT